MNEIEELETGDPSVPTELLELHMELEYQGLTPKEFKEVMNNGSSEPL